MGGQVRRLLARSESEVHHDGPRRCRGAWRLPPGLTGSAWAQALPTSATIESIPIELTMPENYQVTSVLEPVRRVALVAPADGIVREPRGAAGRRRSATTQEIAQLDRTEAIAWVKMAQADVKEKQAAGGIGRAASRRMCRGPARGGRGQGRARPARARSPDAPGSRSRAGSSPLHVSTGQYVLKGTVIAELADVTSLKIAGARRSPDGHRGTRSRRSSSRSRSRPPRSSRSCPCPSVCPAPRAGRTVRRGLDHRPESTRASWQPGLRVRSATLPSDADRDDLPRRP